MVRKGWDTGVVRCGGGVWESNADPLHLPYVPQRELARDNKMGPGRGWYLAHRHPSCTKHRGGTRKTRETV